MKFQLLPSTFDETGAASRRQHLTCFIVDDCVAVDAGSLAMAASDVQKKNVRDILLTHAHLDHIAGLPLFIDDLFTMLTEPVRIHASRSVIDVLERDIFNWSVYPRFSELSNDVGPVVDYREFVPGTDFLVRHLSVRAIEVNHKVPSTGFVLSDGSTTIALSGDTAEMNGFWDEVNRIGDLSAILIECAFPDELKELADTSHHLTPKRLKRELEKLDHLNCPVYIVNLKPMYREQITRQLDGLKIGNLRVLEVGRVYEL